VRIQFQGTRKSFERSVRGPFGPNAPGSLGGGVGELASEVVRRSSVLRKLGDWMPHMRSPVEGGTGSKGIRKRVS